MSNTPPKDTVINFEEKRREYIIREVIKKQIHDPEEIVQMLSMHEFLLFVEDVKSGAEEIDHEAMDKLETDIETVKEKFNELFEIIK